jgi:hypothetical protein
MAAFPKLKTGAVAQFPAGRALAFSNQSVQFVDGSAQRYRDSAGALRRWEIRLSNLDEAELAKLEEFFAANQGAFGGFAFTDPWDGVEHSDCSFDQDALAADLMEEMRLGAALTIRENRG